MQRLISFFHEPQDDWPGQAGLDIQQQQEPPDQPPPPSLPEPTEPVYFAELIAYVRQRNEKFRWPEEGKVKDNKPRAVTGEGMTRQGVTR